MKLILYFLWLPVNFRWLSASGAWAPVQFLDGLVLKKHLINHFPGMLGSQKKKKEKTTQAFRSPEEFIFIGMHTYHRVWPIHQNDKPDLYIITHRYQ